MALDNRSEETETTGFAFRAWLPMALVICFFGLAAVWRPDLIFEIAIAGAVSFLALLLVGVQEDSANSQDINRRFADRSSVDANLKAALPFFDALQFPVFILDAKANIRYFNEQSASAFGELRVGERITIAFRQPEFRTHLEQAIASAKASVFLYNETVPNDRWYSVECSLVPNSRSANANSEQIFLLSFHDQSEAHKMDQMRSDFIANASHELRTPLASLLGYIETLRGPAREDAEAQERFMGVMQDQAERMTRLVNDLLSLSRIEMKAHVRPNDSVSLREVLESVISSLKAVTSKLEMKITLELEGDLIVVGDRDELIQVFENLVENACKYGEEGKKVVISANSINDNTKASVRIRDFGPGISIEHQHRITERFYRIDVARSREKQGTGLGLAIVKHILHRHGTRLAINSVPGDGAEFSVSLPLYKTRKQ